MSIDPKRTAVVLIEYQNDFTSEGGALHGAVAGVMEKTGHARQHAPSSSSAHARPARRSFTRRSRSPPVITRSPPTRTGSSRGSSTRPRSSRASGARRSSTPLAPQAGRRRRRGQARARHVRDDEPRLHPPRARDRHDRARRVPDQLLRRVDDADRLREGLQGDHAVRLRRGHLDRRARERDQVRLPDVLRGHDLEAHSRSSSALRRAERHDGPRRSTTGSRSSRARRRGSASGSRRRSQREGATRRDQLELTRADRRRRAGDRRPPLRPRRLRRRGRRRSSRRRRARPRADRHPRRQRRRPAGLAGRARLHV